MQVMLPLPTLPTRHLRSYPKDSKKRSPPVLPLLALAGPSEQRRFPSFSSLVTYADNLGDASHLGRPSGTRQDYGDLREMTGYVASPLDADVYGKETSDAVPRVGTISSLAPASHRDVTSGQTGTV